MSKFALKLIDEIKGRDRIYELIISGKSEFEECWEKYKKINNLKGELVQIQQRLNMVSNLQYSSLPKEKFRELKKAGNDKHKEYEIKTKHLRVYLFKDEGNGKVIVTMGTKESQDEDLKRFRAIKKEYFKNK